jgi:hypothetical protein
MRKCAFVCLLFILSSSLYGQKTRFVQSFKVKAPAACGSWDINFDVKLDASPQTPAEPESGRAKVYFIQDAGTLLSFGYPTATTKIAIDGNWVGVNEKRSYFSVSVEPGEHHVCVVEQTHMPWEKVELAHFVAEAGNVYYFRIQRSQFQNGSTQYLEFHPADSDEAKYLIASDPLSVSRAKK